MRTVVESFYLNQFLQNSWFMCRKISFLFCKKKFINPFSSYTHFPNKLGAKVLTHRQDYYPSKTSRSLSQRPIFSVLTSQQITSAILVLSHRAGNIFMQCRAIMMAHCQWPTYKYTGTPGWSNGSQDAVEDVGIELPAVRRDESRDTDTKRIYEAYSSSASKIIDYLKQLKFPTLSPGFWQYIMPQTHLESLVSSSWNHHVSLRMPFTF